MSDGADAADVSELGGDWRDFPSLLKASTQILPAAVTGAQQRAAIHPWMQCQIAGPSVKTGKLGGVTIGNFPTKRACAMAWDVCYHWQVLHGQAGKKAGYNFPEAGYDKDDKLAALLQAVPTVQQAASLVRKALLVPPPLPDDKRRALAQKGGERPRLPRIGLPARTTSRFTLAADHVLKLHLTADVFNHNRLLFKDHFFDHMWGGIQAHAGSARSASAGTRQQGQAAVDDDQMEDEEESSDEEEGSGDEGAAAGRIRKPRPAPLWLTTDEGEEFAIGFNRAGKDGWSLKCAELKRLLDALDVTEANVQQCTLVFTPPAGTAIGGSTASRAGYLQATVRLELKAAPQQAAANGASAAAAAAAADEVAADTAATVAAAGNESEAAAAAAATQEGAAAAAGAGAASESTAGLAMEAEEAGPLVEGAAVAREEHAGAAKAQPPPLPQKQQQQQPEQQPVTPPAAVDPPHVQPPSNGENLSEARPPALLLLMRKLFKVGPGASSGRTGQQQQQPAAGGGSKRPCEPKRGAAAGAAGPDQQASKRLRQAQQAQQPQQEEVIDLTMSSDDEEEEIDIVEAPLHPAAHGRPPAPPEQQASRAPDSGCGGCSEAAGGRSSPCGPACKGAAGGPAAAGGAQQQLSKAEQYVAVMARLQQAEVTGETCKAFADRYHAQPDSQRAVWHARITAAADGAAVRQAVAELLGHGHRNA